MKFKVGERVETAKGSAKVTYFEDGYCEIEYDNGGIASFEGDSLSKIRSLRIEAAEEAKRKAEMQQTANLVVEKIEVDNPDLITNAKSFYLKSSNVVRQIGGESKIWDELNAMQKLHFVFMGNRIEVEKLFDAFYKNELATLGKQKQKTYSED